MHPQRKAVPRLVRAGHLSPSYAVTVCPDQFVHDLRTVHTRT